MGVAWTWSKSAYTDYMTRTGIPYTIPYTGLHFTHGGVVAVSDNNRKQIRANSKEASREASSSYGSKGSNNSSFTSCNPPPFSGRNGFFLVPPTFPFLPFHPILRHWGTMDLCPLLHTPSQRRSFLHPLLHTHQQRLRTFKFPQSPPKFCVRWSPRRRLPPSHTSCRRVSSPRRPSP